MRSRGNRSMPAGTGRVGREDGRRAHLGEGLVELEAVLGDELRHPLEALEPGVALVRVVHVRGRAAVDRAPRAHRAHAADAEQQLLQQAVLAAAAVEAVGDAAHLLGVGRRLGVEQQQRDAADVGDPHAGVQLPVARQVERDLDRGAVGVAQEGEAETVRVEQRVGLALPAVVADRLAEVAGAVEEADAGERHAEVGRALEVIAREDAEAARVLGERAVDAELRREVGDVGGLVALEALEPAVALEVGGEALVLGAHAARRTRRRARARRASPDPGPPASGPGSRRSRSHSSGSIDANSACVARLHDQRQLAASRSSGARLSARTGRTVNVRMAFTREILWARSENACTGRFRADDDIRGAPDAA